MPDNPVQASPPNPKSRKSRKKSVVAKDDPLSKVKPKVDTARKSKKYRASKNYSKAIEESRNLRVSSPKKSKKTRNYDIKVNLTKNDGSPGRVTDFRNKSMWENDDSPSKIIEGQRYASGV